MKNSHLARFCQTGITAATLKWIAIIAMAIDHIGAIALDAYMGIHDVSAAFYTLYDITRAIGRIAMPIFCFLLVEGLTHTHCRWRYALRLLIFSAVSEIPFDLALSMKWWDPYDQNVFFTLFLGFVAIWGIRSLTERKKRNKTLCFLLCAAITAAAAWLAAFLRADYAHWGVLTIVVIFLLRANNMAAFTGGCVTLFWGFRQPEAAAFAGLFPIYLYNGQKGRMNKWVGYAFYPLHLLLLAGITALIMLPA